MNSSYSSSPSSEEQNWIDAYLDGTIDPEAFERLQERMLASAALRHQMRRHLSLDHSLETLGGEAPEANWPAAQAQPATPNKTIAFPANARLAAAAAIAFFLGAVVMAWRSGDDGQNLADDEAPSIDAPLAEGFAVIRKLYGVSWPEGENPHQEGDSLGSETLRLEAGTAEIQFFSGAHMTVEGPAEILFKSAWEAQCRDGLVRMQVPPAARGFKLQAPATEIVDLGTEFGLSVRQGKSQVEVFDGEISIRHQGEEERLLKEGASFDLPADSQPIATSKGSIRYPDTSGYQIEADTQLRNSRRNWQAFRSELMKDERLLAYYPFEGAHARSTTPSMTEPRNPELDGTIVLAEPVAGRWPGDDTALEFRRPGSRVRINIPGEFEAFTFAAWVRIDSLDRQYNALFMGDGYENGEPHWQIRSDGQMMISVMVDEDRPNPNNARGRGFHRIYFSPPIWDLSMSGQWLHLASVYDPENRIVAHYVNGEKIEGHQIHERDRIETLRIGNAEIGNWGEPFRKDPSFSIRNLNGRIDDMAVFKAALSDGEITNLYERSRFCPR